MSVNVVEDLDPPPSVGPKPPSRSVIKDLAKGTSALAIGTVIERGLGFLGNIFAARVAGTSVFGAYSLAMTTANMIASYAAGGIGSTAARYSAQYPRENENYSALVKALIVISGVSAAIAIAFLYSSSGLVADLLLRNPGITPTLRIAAFSAGGLILLECCRGFFVGQRKLVALILLSLIVGGTMITALPIVSHFGASVMIGTHACVAMTAVAVCLLLSRRLELQPLVVDPPSRFGHLLREIWRFGLVQLSGLIALNLGGWWLTSLVARSDKTLAQVGLFSISMQLRNMVALAPAMLSEVAVGLMVDPQGSKDNPSRVLAICTFVSVALTVVCAGVGILVAPWALPMVYGKAFAGAVLPVTLSLATAVVHMGSAPASMRVTVLSIRYWGWTNVWWAIFVAVFATLFVSTGGAAAGAAVYLGAQALVAVLLFRWLQTRSLVADGVIPIYAAGSIGTLTVTALAYARYTHPELTGVLTLAIAATLLSNVVLIYSIGRRSNVAPGVPEIRRALTGLTSQLHMLRGSLR